MTHSTTPQTQPMPSSLLLLISFLGGFQIMVLEMCGFRVLQTNLGSSVIVTGTLLTMIMVLLSAGYYCGGRLSHNFAHIRMLIILLILAVFYTHTVNVLLADVITAWSAEVRNAFLHSPFLRSGLPALFLSLILYGPPIFVMSMISPFLIRLRTMNATKDRADAGLQS